MLCTYWEAGDHVVAFREDSKRLQDLFLRLNYPSVTEFAIQSTESGSSLEGAIWEQLDTLQGSPSVLIFYYGAHGEKGGEGRWVA